MAITTWNGVSNTSSNDASKAPISQQKITIQLAGSRQACERFCDGLKKGLKNAVADVGKLKRVVAECYSEHLLSGEKKSSDPPDKKPELDYAHKPNGNWRILKTF